MCALQRRWGRCVDENTVRRRSIAIPRLQPVETDADIERLAKLAHEIWFEYWPAHIGEAQTRYMVERFQTAEAIRRDMASSAYEYWFVLAPDDGRVVGYTGGRAEPKTGASSSPRSTCAPANAAATSPAA